MASFFRKRIAQKVLSMLQKKQDLKISSSFNHVSTAVKVNRFKCYQPQLILPWKKIEQLCDQTITVNPKELVRLLRNQGLPTAEGFIDIELSETPFLSLIFTVDKHIFSKIVLLDICTNEDDLTKSSCLFEDVKKENVVVMCSVPPVGVPCQLTHFRTLMHSNYVANINKFVGHNVTKVAHVNDWGPEAATFLTGFKQFKTGEAAQNKGANYLLEVYKAALLEYNSDFKFKLDSDSCYDKMKQGNPRITSEWQELKRTCMNYYDSIYGRLGVHFDELHFDSSCFQKSEKITNQILHSNIITNRDGNEINCDELRNNEYIRKIINIDSTLYNLSRHISAATEMKERHNFNTMYYISPSSQRDFLSALFYIMKKLDFTWAEHLHPVNLKVISNFDSKRNKKLNIEAVLDEVKDRMITKLHENLQMDINESLEEMAEHLSLSSLVVNDMKHRRNVDYTFDWKEIISFKKDSAASFQFCSAGLKGLQDDNKLRFSADMDTSPLLEPEAHSLIRHLARYFTDLVTNVLKLDRRKEKRLIVIKARLLLLSATLKILNKGLGILGVTPLETVYSPEKAFVHSK